MKAILFSFLALGLTSVFAAPAPESELAAQPPCNIICKPGYVLSGTKCKCVLNNEQICLRETICIGTHHPVWNAKTKKCTCEPYDFVAQEKCLREQICIATHHPVWNSNTKTCSCELTVIEEPTKENCLLATTCLEGSYPFWNPKTKKCSCNSNDAEFICKAATTCSPGSTPIWHPETESCICEKVAKRDEFPDPKTCPTIRCGEGTSPKYIPKTGRCICEPNPATCPTIKCSAGFKPLHNPKTKTCSCVPDPEQCSNWMCIAEKRPVYDPVSKKCGCQWIPGLEPTPTPAATHKRSAEPQHPPPSINPGCKGIYCIAEKRPIYNQSTKQCGCEWIPGFGPIVARAAEPEPQKNDPLNCRRLKVYCEFGDHYMVYDFTSKICVCPTAGVVG